MISARAPQRDRQAGVTLVEMLVTVAIIGVMTGMVTLGAGHIGRSDGAHDEAVRLAAVLNAGSDAALADGRDRLLTLTDDGYSVGADAPYRLRPGTLVARQDATDLPVLLSGSGTGGAVTLVLTDNGGAWGVAFDGLRARVVDIASSDRGIRP